MAEEIKVKVKSDKDKNFENLVDQFKEKSENPDRIHDRGIVNENNQSSILIEDNGDISISTGYTTNVRMNQDKIIKNAIEERTVTNRRILDLDELIINNQKLNPQLIELSSTKVLFDSEIDTIGNLSAMGTVLVKAWEPNLKKYVLIRRKIRLPIFSQKLNNIDAPEVMDTATKVVVDLTVDSSLLLKQEKIEIEKGTGIEIPAEGGSVYNQGDYNNYLTDFIINSNSISGSNGYDTDGTSNNPTNTSYMTTDQDIITGNASHLDYVWPVPSSTRITSPYGERVLNGKTQHHNGIDIGQNYSEGANTKICAAADGTVIDMRNIDTQSGEALRPYTGYGNCIVIQHADGLKTLYAHLSKIRVTKGSTVKQGQWIGDMGDTPGEPYAFGIHLHISFFGNYGGTEVELKKGIDPEKFIKPQN